MDNGIQLYIVHCLCLPKIGSIITYILYKVCDGKLIVHSKVIVKFNINSPVIPN